MPAPSASSTWSREDSGATLDLLRLHLATVYHPEISGALLERFGDAGRLLRRMERPPADASPRRERLRRRLGDPAWMRAARQEIETCRREGVGILQRGGPGWPPNLAGLPMMPLALFFKGSWTEEDREAIAIVGSRRPSPYGLRQARRFSAALAERGFTIISGLARGIDSEAHRAALDRGGRTIGILGSGLGRIYPRDNRGLAAAIIESGRGVLATEFPWSTAPLRHHFPQRNRILSGLALGLLVVEAGERSGSLLTVDWALEQDRPVFALPGRVDQLEARGCLRLIQSGAWPVLDPEEVENALRGDRRRGGPPAGAGPDRAPAWVDKADPFLECLRPLFAEEDAWHPDALAERLRLIPAVLLAELSRLEGEGRLKRVIGGRFILVSGS